ncbi:hypothetical protein [Kordia sp.]|uniref:hypothetical protein n=1 Tax=Kordia sp. TaxID=1965332 RepID=UPI003B5B0414
MERKDFIKKFDKIATKIYKGSGIKRTSIGSSWVIYTIDCFHFDLILEFAIELDLETEGNPDQFYYALEANCYWEHECEYGYNMSFGKSNHIPLTSKTDELESFLKESKLKIENLKEHLVDFDKAETFLLNHEYRTKENRNFFGNYILGIVCGLNNKVEKAKEYLFEVEGFGFIDDAYNYIYPKHLQNLIQKATILHELVDDHERFTTKINELVKLHRGN